MSCVLLHGGGRYGTVINGRGALPLVQADTILETTNPFQQQTDVGAMYDVFLMQTQRYGHVVEERVDIVEVIALMEEGAAHGEGALADLSRGK
jgi:bifunctional N-acetylglucosamine-1-phosphate-uridyltransferase/glucosamine-1-phosphate-acetyltransferase GlmU-like protein